MGRLLGPQRNCHHLLLLLLLLERGAAQQQQLQHCAAAAAAACIEAQGYELHPLLLMLLCLLQFLLLI